ncbi:MAG TPA: M1 family metallopeptidase [Micromonosporaceae bacterium]|nr:M1 family metallopeptidase [Micromonosporaceae bacterium]
MRAAGGSARTRVGRGVVAVVCAALVAAGCTTGHPSAVAAPTAPSGHAGSSGAASAQPHSTSPAPGAATSGDSLFPNDGNGGYDVTHYGITISYDPSTKTLTGTDTITAVATQALSRFDLDLHALTVSSVTVSNVSATFSRSADKLIVAPKSPLADGAKFTVTIRYGGVPKPYDDPALGFEGFIPEPDGALAQGEPQVAASWFPVNDRPTDKATYDITITAPSTLAAISNGVLASKRANGGDTTWHWVESAPMASYLALVAIGNYRVTTSTHNGLPVVLAVADSLPRSVDTALAQTPTVLDFLVSQFGAYPFDAVGGVVHNDGRIRFALENQTRPTYAPAFFMTPQDSTTVIAHELTHQWFGDSVSVGDWSDVWLNEGFATYAEWLWSEHEGRETPKEQFDDIYKSGGLPLDPPAAPTEATVFGRSSYLRGAATLEALRIAVGDDTFWRIVRGWAQLHAGGNATTAEFIAYADQVSGRSLDTFLHAWLYERGKPAYPTRLG